MSSACDNEITNIICMALFFILAILMAVLFLPSLPLGIYYTNEYVTKAQDPPAVLGHNNDTVLLEHGISGFHYSSVTVQQCADNGDEHTANIYLIKSEDVKKKSVKKNCSTETHHADSPSYKSGIIDYLYLLPGSSFTYMTCLASTTNYSQNVPYYLFGGQHNYAQYVHDPDNGEKYSLLSKNLVANRNNQTKCTSISHTVSDGSYYFMVLNSPANIAYSYNFSLHKVEYSITDTEISCNVSSSNDCLLLLSSNFVSQTTYDVLADVQPYFGEKLTTTSLCVNKFVASQKIKAAVAVCLLTGCLAFILFIVSLVIARFFKKKNRQYYNI